jgi:hypothetical protein
MSICHEFKYTVLSRDDNTYFVEELHNAIKFALEIYTDNPNALSREPVLEIRNGECKIAKTIFQPMGCDLLNMYGVRAVHIHYTSEGHTHHLDIPEDVRYSCNVCCYN